MELFLKKLLSILILLTLTVTALVADEKTTGTENNAIQYRNMIIIIDSEIEDVSIDYSLAALPRLASALTEKSAPILVSTSVWKNFIERIQEMESGALFPETDEYKILAFFNNYTSRINFWSNYFSKQKNNDPSENKNLIIEKINNELQTKEMLEAINVKNLQRIKGLLPFYSIHFNAKEWTIQNVSGYFYLLMPNILTNSYNDILHLDKLEKIQRPTDITTLLFKDTDRPEGNFVHTLSSLFKENNAYSWNVSLFGHGANEKILGLTRRLVANLSISEFKKVLKFFNDSISTNTLIYSSCYGAGDQLRHIYFNNNKNTVYNYTIAVSCLTDNVSYGHRSNVIYNNGKLTEDDLVYDVATKQWQVKLYPCNWEKFFSLLTAGAKTFDAKQWLTLIENIEPKRIENIPNVRRAGTDKFVIMHPDRSKISKLLVGKKNNDSIIINGNNLRRILLDSSVINVPCKISGNTSPEIIISVLPGQATHYFSNVQAKSINLTSFLLSFIPFSSSHSIFEKIIVIERLNCKINPQSTEAKLLHTEDKQDLTITKMILRIQKNQLVRISFQNYDGITYSAHMIKSSYLRGITPLNEEGAKAHKDYFKQAKEKAFLTNHNLESLIEPAK